MSYQQITVVGNAGKDPEVRYTASGKAVANFSVAVNEGSGEKKETTWFNVVAWEKLAEICGEYIKKGKQVLVVGRLQLRKYEDKKGEERTSVEIVAQTMRLLGGKPESEQSREPRPQPAQRSSQTRTGADQFGGFDNAGAHGLGPDDVPF